MSETLSPGIPPAGVFLFGAYQLYVSEFSCISRAKLLVGAKDRCPFVCVVGSSLGDGYALSPGRSSG